MYTIGTLGSITILFPFIDFNVVSSQEWAKTISIGLLTLFFLAYTIYPLVHRDILKNHLHHLLWGHLVATLFVLIEIYQYGHAYFNDAHLGLSFLVASIFFAIISFLIYGFTQEESAKNLPENTTLKWSRHLYLASAITAFSLAIAFLASGHASLISILRLLESSILFYFFSKIKEKQRYYAGMVLMGIGLLKTVFLIPTVSSGERTMLIPLIFILATLVYNLRITQKLSVELQESEFFILHDVFNFVGMVLMGIFLRRLLPSTVYGRGLLGLTCF
ncbi:MAG: hypothetical protein LBD11_02900 [Candidatus Peribacteria bacterium]|jgi:hypothetical protein|nr:hypothetical protein [Candidatus Peribacteria bacterium]